MVERPAARFPCLVRRGRGGLLGVSGLVLSAMLLGLAGAAGPSQEPAAAGQRADPVAPRAGHQLADAPVVRLAARELSWRGPLVVLTDPGELVEVRGAHPDGRPLTGRFGSHGRWSSTGPLVPDAVYQLTGSVRDPSGAVHQWSLTARTRAAKKVLHASISPGDDRIVGVGQPVSVRLSRPVPGSGRAEVQRRLSVTATPPVTGAWRWMSDTEVHYRPARFWAPGTQIEVVADLNHLALPGGAWGSGRRTSSYRIGEAVTALVDVRRHTMTVRRAGRVLRVLPASMGKPGFDTRNGTFLVLEKFERRIMDSATVNLPPGTPAYRTAVRHAVRLSYSGTFTHGAPWSVRSQGSANVSHGCINLSPADAAWFYRQVRRGDVVRVVGSPAGPLPHDPGSRDWNMSFAQWTSSSSATKPAEQGVNE